MVKEKQLSSCVEEKRKKIDWNHPWLSISRQCNLLSLSKGAVYYRAVPMDSYNLELMDKIDEQYLKTPFYGSRKITVYLRNAGYQVNRKRIQRLMQLMGLEAIYPKANLSKRRHDHKIYPYLLKGLAIERPNQVWSTDITYIRLRSGFMYLTAVIDWYSRYVLSWRLSNALESRFCVEALEEALDRFCAPEIFNTDQGCQFTSETFLDPLLQRNIKISMDSKGRALDNVFIERLWRSLKYEEVYLKDYETVREASLSIGKYFTFFNYERPHQSLEYKTPSLLYPS